jgi:hypothetical protein
MNYRRRSRTNDSILPAWWDQRINPRSGPGYSAPLTWGALLGPLLLVAVVLLWKYVVMLAGACVIGYVVYQYATGIWGATPWGERQRAREDERWRRKFDAMRAEAQRAKALAALQEGG